MTAPVKPLVFRVDAGPTIGTGHVMRCLSLAQQWHDTGGKTLFAFAEASPAVADRVRAAGAEVIVLGSPPGSLADANETARQADQVEAQWVVVDGYHFGTDFQLSLKNRGKRVLAIDDYGHCVLYVANVVLNQNLYASDALYRCRDEATRLLLGPRYLLLRREFAHCQDRQRSMPEIARKLLITLGGADPENVTLKALHALQHVSERAFETTVLVGPTNPHRDGLEEAARGLPGVRVLAHVDDMPGLMSANDLAITAGGTTTWELAFMGLPALQIVLADNQREVVASAAAAGFAINLGWHATVTPEVIARTLDELSGNPFRRGQMIQAGHNLFDTEGPARVCMLLEGTRLRLRRTRLEDAELLWNWANEPEVRSRGFHTDPIPWEAHLGWLTNKLRSPDAFLFIGMDAKDGFVGQVRLDRTGTSEAIISISVVKERRGEGWGTDLIEAATQWGFRQLGLAQVTALIKPDNIASCRAFEKAGFTSIRRDWINGAEAIRATCSRVAA